MILLFKNYLLVEVMYLLIRFSKSKFFPWNTNSTEGNGVNKQNTHTHTHTHTHQTLREITPEKAGESLSIFTTTAVKKLNLDLGFEIQSHMWYLFGANFHLKSLFYRVIIRKKL